MISLCCIILKDFCVNNSKGMCWLIHKKIQQMCVMKIMFDDELHFHSGLFIKSPNIAFFRLFIL